MVRWTTAAGLKAIGKGSAEQDYLSLVAELAAKVRSCREKFYAQAVGTALYGIQVLSGAHEEVLQLVSLRRAHLVKKMSARWPSAKKTRSYMYNPCMVPYGRILDRMENNPKGGAATTSGWLRRGRCKLAVLRFSSIN